MDKKIIYNKNKSIAPLSNIFRKIIKSYKNMVKADREIILKNIEDFTNNHIDKFTDFYVTKFIKINK